jgi:hypothetical protein
MASKPKHSRRELTATATPDAAAPDPSGPTGGTPEPDNAEVAALEPVVRTARSVRPVTDTVSDRPVPGASARGAVRLARHLDVALSRRASDPTAPMATSPAVAAPSLPWGVWPTADATATDDQLAALGGALASYARMLRAKRGAPPPPARGIPLIVRRGGATAGGPRRGPGGLVRSMVPVDQPIAPPAPERRAPAPLRPPGGR